MGALEGSRTPNLLIRSQVLYPIELQVHYFIYSRKIGSFLISVLFEMECKDRITFQSITFFFKKTYNFMLNTR
jgi:hypothetical protein